MFFMSEQPFLETKQVEAGEPLVIRLTWQAGVPACHGGLPNLLRRHHPARGRRLPDLILFLIHRTALRHVLLHVGGAALRHLARTGTLACHVAGALGALPLAHVLTAVLTPTLAAHLTRALPTHAAPLTTGLGIKRCAKRNESCENGCCGFRFVHDAVPLRCE
jgi:hypothetical protein